MRPPACYALNARRGMVGSVLCGAFWILHGLLFQGGLVLSGTIAVDVQNRIRESSVNTGELYKSGDQAFKSGDCESAVDYFSRAIEQKPGYAFLHVRRGLCYGILGKYTEAFNDFDRAISLDPSDSRAYHLRGTILRKQGDLVAAIDDFSKSIALKSDFAPVCISRGSAYAHMNNFALALSDLDRAIELAPKLTKALSVRGTIYVRLKKFDMALPDFQNALKIDPRAVGAINNMAWLYATASDAKYLDGKKAVELATQVCEQWQWKRSTGLDTLAAAYARMGEFDKAVDWQTKANALKLQLGDDNEGGRERLELYRRGQAYVES